MPRSLVRLLLLAVCSFIVVPVASAAVWKPPIATITSAPGQAGPWNPEYTAAAPDGSVVYVGNNAAPEVWVISTTTHAATGVFTLPAPATGARTVMVDASGSYLYVGADGLTGAVDKLDAHTGAFLGTVATISESNFPTAMSISPDGRKLYATGWNSPAISVTDLGTNSVTTLSVPNVSQIQQAAISPDGRWLYAPYMDGTAPAVPKTGVVKIDVTNPSSYSTWPIDATNQIDVTSLVSTPDGSALYALNEDYADLYKFDPTTGARTTIDLGSSCDSPFCAWGNAQELGMSPCGCSLLAAVGHAGTVQLWQVDLGTNAVMPLAPSDGFSYSGAHDPFGPIFAADGTTAYIANRFSPGASIDVISAPGKPSAPGGLTATAGVGKVDVSYSTPGDGNSPITDYEYSLDGGTTWVSARTTGTNFSITGLTAGTTYSVTVRAVNAYCKGLASAAVTATPSGSSSGGSTPAGTNPAPSGTQAADEASPKIAIPAASVAQGATLASNVSPSVAGTVKVTATLRGRTVCTATKKATRAGRMTVTCNLSTAAKAAIRIKPVTLTVTARLTDAQGKTATASRKVKVARYRVKVPVTG